MTLDEFAETTRRVIAKEGPVGFLPTGCWPARKQVAVLEGVPETIDLEDVAIKWATKKSEPNEEFLLAFSIGPSQFKVIRRYQGRFESAIFDGMAT